MTKVRCRDCAYCLLDKIGDSNGVSRCKVYSHYKTKGIPENELKSLLFELGNPYHEVFWAGQVKDRECNKFKGKDND